MSNGRNKLSQLLILVNLFISSGAWAQCSTWITGDYNVCANSVTTLSITAYYDNGDTEACSATSVEGSANWVDAQGRLHWGNVPGVYRVFFTCPGGCTNIEEYSVLVHEAEIDYPITGGGTVCTGSQATITLAGSQIGLDYGLVKDGTYPAIQYSGNLGGPISWTVSEPGTYRVYANEGCSYWGPDGHAFEDFVLTGSAVVAHTSPPQVLSVQGGGAICAGAVASITMPASQSGIHYELRRNDGQVVGTTVGTGGQIAWSSITPPTGSWTYSVKAGSNTLCSRPMSGNPSIVVNPLPAQYAVVGSGLICPGSGRAITLNGSQTNTTYQLFRNGGTVGDVLNGSGSILTWAAQPEGSYTVTATSTVGNCTRPMLDNATVTITTQPLQFTLDNGGIICPDSVFSISMQGSQTGMNYGLVVNGTPAGATVSGTGNSITWSDLTAAGVYAVQITDAGLGCSYPLNETAVFSTIEQYPLSGGGILCDRSPGVGFQLTSSQPGVQYQLKINGRNTGAPLTGTGGTLNWTGRTLPGNYTVEASHPDLQCVEIMTDTAVARPSPIQVFALSKRDGPACGKDTIRLNGSQDSVVYKLIRETGSDVGFSPVNGTGSPLGWSGLYQAAKYTVEATHTSSGCKTIMPGSIALTCGFDNLYVQETLTVALTEPAHGDYSLAVGGKILTAGLNLQSPALWPDYVFTDKYDLPTLGEVQDFIEKNGHLPNVPSAKQMQEQKHYGASAMDATLLEKVEGLALYILDIDSEIQRAEFPFDSFSVPAFEESPQTQAVTGLKKSAPLAASTAPTSLFAHPASDASDFLNVDITQSLSIGASKTASAEYKLLVSGNTIAAGIDIKAAENWPDYVFDRNYQLPTIDELKGFIKKHRHLPALRSAKEMEALEHYDVAAMDATLLEKIEELTLYVIQLKTGLTNATHRSPQVFSEPQPLRSIPVNRQEKMDMALISDAFTQASTENTPATTNASMDKVTVTGAVCVGTTSPVPGYKLVVAGNVLATGASIKPPHKWPDYVFNAAYGLRTLSEMRDFIRRNGHLPAVPSAIEMAANKHYSIADMDAALLEKIEELTLYIIELNSRIEALKKHSN